MKDLIEALTIIQNCLLDPETRWPTSCEHDLLYVYGVNFDKVTVDMIHKLAKLGFYPGSDDDDVILIQCNDEGEYVEIDFDTIDEDTWDSIKHNLTDCFRSFRFGSC